MSSACSRPRRASSASFTPPALPRPPVLTWALTTTGLPMRSAAARASSAVVDASRRRARARRAWRRAPSPGTRTGPQQGSCLLVGDAALRARGSQAAHTRRERAARHTAAWPYRNARSAVLLVLVLARARRPSYADGRDPSRGRTRSHDGRAVPVVDGPADDHQRDDRHPALRPGQRDAATPQPAILMTHGFGLTKLAGEVVRPRDVPRPARLRRPDLHRAGLRAEHRLRHPAVPDLRRQGRAAAHHEGARAPARTCRRRQRARSSGWSAGPTAAASRPTSPRPTRGSARSPRPHLEPPGLLPRPQQLRRPRRPDRLHARAQRAGRLQAGVDVAVLRLRQQQPAAAPPTGAGGLPAGQARQRRSDEVAGAPCLGFYPAVCRTFATVTATGDATPTDRDLLADSSAATRSTSSSPGAAVQGQADTLFNLNDAVATYTALRAPGVPVQMVWNSGGHGGYDSLPGECDVYGRGTGGADYGLDDCYLRCARCSSSTTGAGRAPTGPRLHLVPRLGAVRREGATDAVRRAPRVPLASPTTFTLSGTRRLVTSARTAGSATFVNPPGGVPPAYTETSNFSGPASPAVPLPPTEHPGQHVDFTPPPFTTAVESVGVPSAVRLSHAAPTDLVALRQGLRRRAGRAARADPPADRTARAPRRRSWQRRASSCSASRTGSRRATRCG